MSSRFVSAGAIDAASGEAIETPAADAGTSTAASPPPVAGGGLLPARAAAPGGLGTRHEEWEAVRKELDEQRRRREEERKKAADVHGAGGERSLFEVLQANKAAKQAAFEEKNKIKNQFRPLDDDEVDFLDTVRSSARAIEERIRRETEQELDAFRAAQRQREQEAAEAAAESAGGEQEADAEEGGGESWAVSGSRKRKRERDREGRAAIRGLKRQTSSSAAEEREDTVKEVAGKLSTNGRGHIDSTSAESKDAVVSPERKDSTSASKPKLGLVAYGSDDDDDDDD